MICGIQMVGQWKRTLAMAVVRIVARRRDNPIAPAHILEVHVERMPSTCLLVILATRASLMPAIATAPVAAAAALPGAHVPNRTGLVPPVVCVGEEQRLLVLPLIVRLVRTAA